MSSCNKKLTNHHPREAASKAKPLCHTGNGPIRCWHLLQLARLCRGKNQKGYVLAGHRSGKPSACTLVGPCAERSTCPKAACPGRASHKTL
eukprot:3535817-Amphidinium_carterae.1